MSQENSFVIGQRKSVINVMSEKSVRIYEILTIKEAKNGRH